MHKYFSVLLALMLASSGTSVAVQAQTTGQTVTKTFAQKVNCTHSTLLSVNAEKASVEVTGWSNNYILAHISFYATHPDKETALRELDYMRFAIVKEKDLVELNNVFALPAAIDHIQSKLEVKIVLKVPSGNRLRITNKYGNVSITQLSGNTTVDISFGDLLLNEVSGNVKITAEYSEVRGSHIHTTSLHCTDEKSKISMDLEAGTCSFLSKYGDIDLTVKNISALDIKSSRTDVTIRPQDINGCRYKIVSTDGAIYLPEKYASRIVKKGNQVLFTTSGATTMPVLAVNATYNSVTIK